MSSSSARPAALGAIPVIYLPRVGGAERGPADGIGETFLARLADIEDTLSSLAEAIERGEVQRKAPPGRGPRDLVNAARAFAGLIYPANRTEDDLIEYFRQREWRIVANIAGPTGAVSHPLSAECRARVEAIDPDFFGRVMQFRSGPHRLLEQTQSIRESGGVHVLQRARTLLVPTDARDDAVRVLAEAGIDLPVEAVG